MRDLAHHGLGLLYPPTCALCGAAGNGDRDLCAGCEKDLPPIGPCCARCAQPFASSALNSSRHHGSICGNCQHQPPPFERCLAAFRYEYPLPEMVAGMKFNAKLNLARLLGELLADAVQADTALASPPLPDALVPVPLHPRRLRARGYNQALELARIVSRRTGIPLAHRCCRRTRATQAQSELDERLRRSNIRGAFQALAPVPERVALLDDVVTTGATVSELAQVLLQAGCHQVQVWALARTP